MADTPVSRAAGAVVIVEMECGHRMAAYSWRGYALGVAVGERRLQVWVSEKGRSVRVFDGNKELSAVGGEGL